MEKNTDNDKVFDAILAFDTLYTNNHMKILKLLLPYVDPKHQKLLTLYIKWQEFVFTMEFFDQYSACICSSDFSNKQSPDIKRIIPLVLPYCTDKEKQLLSQFNQIQNMKDMMDGIKEYFPIIQQFMSSGGFNTSSTTTTDGPGSINIMDMLKNMLSEEQLSMFSMFMDSKIM